MSAPIPNDGLNACGCCDADVARPAIFNWPGLPALAYRVATQPTALRRMLAALPRRRAGDGVARPLGALTVRATDDPAIALLDAWATVTDVLTFYQERIANEGFLRTATERGSVLELARAIGYELSPGVAAGAFLAFTVEDAPGAPGAATVAEGVKIQSIPGQGELPQTFETVETLEARAGWNALRPRRTVAQTIEKGLTRLYLRGVNTLLAPGNAILLCGDERAADTASERWDFRILSAVTPRPPDGRDPDDPGHTIVEWATPLGHADPPVAPSARPAVLAFRQRAALFGHNAPDFRAMADSVKAAFQPNFDPDRPDRRLTQWPGFAIETAGERLIDLDAVYPKILPGSWIALVGPSYREIYRVEGATVAARADFTLTARTTRLHLDSGRHLTFFGLRDTIVFAQTEGLPLAELPLAEPVAGDTIVLDRLVTGLTRGRPLIVSGRRSRARVAEGASGLILQAADGTDRTVALAPGDLLQVLRPPEPRRGGSALWTLRDRDGFEGTVTAPAGALLPQPAAADDPLASEVTFIGDGPDAIVADRDRTTITLRDRLAGSYDRDTVAINANVARATHGETVREALGSGDGAAANQRFTLRRPPLTHVSAPTASGARSTLAVRVNGALWEEAPSLFGLTPHDQCYTVRIGDDGRTTVIFGDGAQGARPPTGTENVTATYRTGIGRAGLVGADRLTLLQTRPLGVRGVTNPLPAAGAADPEDLDEARANAPLTVLTLDRIVSLRDFEDFARAFAGIGKARAVELWRAGARLVHLTVAGVDGAPVEPASDLHANLVRAIDDLRDPIHRVEVAAYTPRRFSLAASVQTDPRLVAAEVLARVADALRAAFAFAPRGFGQPVTAAEVVTVMQGVAGVVAVDLDGLTADDPAVAAGRAPAAARRPHRDPGGAPPSRRVPGEGPPPSLLPARLARLNPDGTVAPAELLLINPAGIRLKELTP